MKELYHIFHDTKETFFKRIDEFGGWPHNAKSVVLKHCCEEKRPCYFCTLKSVRNEWNTSIYTDDDYYWWKISSEKKLEIEKELRNKIRNSI